MSYQANVPSPCKNCFERHIGCHDGCPKYAAFKAALQLERDAEIRAKTLDRYGMRIFKRRK